MSNCPQQAIGIRSLWLMAKIYRDAGRVVDTGWQPLGRSLVCTRGISLKYTRGELISFLHAKLVCTRGSLVCTRGLHG